MELVELFKCKRIAEELNADGIESISKQSSDFLFSVEAQYQRELELDEDDWDIYPSLEKEALHKTKKGENMKELMSQNEANPGVEIIEEEVSKGTVEMNEADFDECPVCGSDSIEYDYEQEPSSVFYYRVHQCRDCESTWEERYDLAQVRITKNTDD